MPSDPSDPPLTSTPRPTLRYLRNATVDHVIDGDTVALLVDLGWQLYAKFSCRLALDARTAIDTPEHGKPGFAAAQAYVAGLLPAGTRVLTESVDMTDKYGGRFDGRIWLPDGRCLAELLVAAGVAKVWPAGAAKPFPRAGEP